MPLSPAQRQRRFRARQRVGEDVYRVVLSRRTVEALINLGRLSELESENREHVALELRALIEERLSLLAQAR